MFKQGQYVQECDILLHEEGLDWIDFASLSLCLYIDDDDYAPNLWLMYNLYTHIM